MAIVTKEMLKSYFVNAKVPGYEDYVDFIDTMGDMNLSVYDANDDGRVEEADFAANADTVDGLHSSAFAPSGYGLGTYAQDISGQDLNGNFATGLYRGSACTNAPASSWYWYIIMSHSNTSWYVQIAVNYYDQKVWVRQKDNGVWTAWKNIYPAAWGDISGKPSTYPPSTHTHYSVEYADVAGNADNADLLDSINSTSFARSDVADTIGGLWSINNDLRIRDGLYVGSTGVNPTNGNVQATADICAGGGIYAGNAGASVTNTWVEASGHLVANGSIFGRAIDSGRFRSGVYVGYANDVDDDCIILKRHQYDAHVYNNTNGSYGASFYLNWYGQTTYNTISRVGNGRSAYGDIHADNFPNESRRSSKRNIRSYKDELPNSLDLIEKIRPIKYKKADPNATNPDQDRIGMIAEELLEVLPEVVVVDQFTGEAEGIDYGQIVPLLILSIQDLRSQIKELQHGRNIGD